MMDMSLNKDTSTLNLQAKVLHGEPEVRKRAFHRRAMAGFGSSHSTRCCRRTEEVWAAESGNLKLVNVKSGNVD